MCFKMLREKFTNIIPSDFLCSRHAIIVSKKLYYLDFRVTARQFFFSVRVVQLAIFAVRW